MNVDYNRVNKYRLWLSSCCKNSSTLRKFYTVSGEPESIYNDIHTIAKTGVKGVAPSIIKSLLSTDPDRLYDKVGESVRKHDIDILFCDDPIYPEKLRICNDAPSMLFLRGRLIPNLICTVGVVGTRNYTEHGAELADVYAYSIAKKGATVVSGMAKGIDTIAAKSALHTYAAAYPTIAVLGSGVDVPTPSENRALYEEIIEKGSVISQFMPGEMPTRYTYPMRNKVIAGLSDALLVIEAGKYSGALITANAAVKYQRKVYSIPARISDKTFEGSLQILRDGRAAFAEDANSFIKSVYGSDDAAREYIIPDIDLDPVITPQDNYLIGYLDKEIKKYDDKKEYMTDMLDYDSKKIYNALIGKDLTFDELVAKSGLPLKRLNHCLTMMEINGLIVQTMGRDYHLVVDNIQ